MEIKEFCLETFLPEVRVATLAIQPLPDEEKTKLMGNFLGTVIKLGYGGIWEVYICFYLGCNCLTYMSNFLVKLAY